MKDMVGGCCVCSDERGWLENPLVYCDGQGCNVAVHQACYGIVKVPSGNWYCEKCAAGVSTAGIRCELCPMQEGALKHTDNKGWAHVICALYIPEVRFGNVSTMDPILLSGVPLDRYGKTCYICERSGEVDKMSRGACMACTKMGCTRYFHVTCAQQDGLLCEESGAYENIKYCGYCDIHVKKLKRDSNVKLIPPFRPPISDERRNSRSPLDMLSSVCESNSNANHQSLDSFKGSSTNFTISSNSGSNNNNNNSCAAPSSAIVDSNASHTLVGSSSVNTKAAVNSQHAFSLSTNVVANGPSSSYGRASGSTGSDMSPLLTVDPKSSTTANPDNGDEKRQQHLQQQHRMNGTSTPTRGVAAGSTVLGNPGHASDLMSSTTTTVGASCNSAISEASKGTFTSSLALHGRISSGLPPLPQQYAQQHQAASVAGSQHQFASSHTPLVVPSSANVNMLATSTTALPTPTQGRNVTTEGTARPGITPQVFNATISPAVNPAGLSSAVGAEPKMTLQGSDGNLARYANVMTASEHASKISASSLSSSSSVISDTSSGPSVNPLPATSLTSQPERKRRAEGSGFGPGRPPKDRSLNDPNAAAKRTKRISSVTKKPGPNNMESLLEQVSPVVADTVSSFQQERVAAAQHATLSCSTPQQLKSVNVGCNSCVSTPTDCSATFATGTATSMQFLSPLSSTASHQNPANHTLTMSTIAHLAEQNYLPTPLCTPLKPSAIAKLSPPSSSGGLDSQALPFPTSLEQLLERQWEQGSQFLMDQAQHFDIASLLNCLNQLKTENQRLEEHVSSLANRRDHLLAVNARLSLPLGTAGALQRSPRVPVSSYALGCDPAILNQDAANSLSGKTIRSPPQVANISPSVSGVIAPKAFQQPSMSPVGRNCPSFPSVVGTSGVFSAVKQKSDGPSPERHSTSGAFAMPRAPTPLLAAADLVRPQTPLALSSHYGLSQLNSQDQMLYLLQQQQAAHAIAAYGAAAQLSAAFLPPGPTSPHRTNLPPHLMQQHASSNGASASSLAMQPHNIPKS